ncbi:PepSY-associated TM helix domain-containing protein [Aliamphritea ceti]|uniref:PepSY-associated TM helix domain-containing protein n=1 Tax=Aliamphritea ceti TaxID=1524258 RepID=UPI0021C2CF60|nr:PepSY-associated TM helix domain-containing protein [Aliamphritea ceti]
MKRLHLALASIFGIFFILLGITGSTLVYRDTFTQISAPKLDINYLDYEVHDIDRLITELESHYTELKVRSIKLPAHPRDHYLFSIRYLNDQQAQSTQIYINPVSMAISPAIEHRNPIEAFVYEFHSSYFMEENGTTLVGITGAGISVLVLIGFYIWMPSSGRFKQSLRVPEKSTGAVLLSWLHRTSGACFTPLLLIISLTGLMLVFRPAMILPFSSSPVISQVDSKTITFTCFSSPGIDDYLYSAEQLFPQADATHIKLPKRDSRLVEITLRHDDEVNSALGLTKVYLDTNCAAPVKYRDGRALTLSEALTETIVSLHNGSFFGVTGQLIYLLTGILPLFFGLSGGILWLSRRRLRRAR